VRARILSTRCTRTLPGKPEAGELGVDRPRSSRLLLRSPPEPGLSCGKKAYAASLPDPARRNRKPIRFGLPPGMIRLHQRELGSLQPRSARGLSPIGRSDRRWPRFVPVLGLPVTLLPFLPDRRYRDLV